MYSVLDKDGKYDRDTIHQYKITRIIAFSIIATLTEKIFCMRQMKFYITDEELTNLRP